MDVGVMFWAGPDPLETLRSFEQLGIRHGQLGVHQDFDLQSGAAEWQQALAKTDFHIHTVFAAYTRESYADIPAVRRTVGFVPPETRKEREQRTLDVSDFAASLGVSSVATHIGCIPDNSADPDSIVVREVVRRICDHAAKYNQTFALETGQESASVLLDFILAANRENLGINFDPANMILYGTGDPIAALDVLRQHVLSVHAKDGDWPSKANPGALGQERPLGSGQVGMERFVAKLHEIDYRGPLFIEREAGDPDQRRRDLQEAAALIRRLL